MVNRLGERTAMHWHGMELDSYYDGVHGWSGSERKLAPMIEPGALLRRALHAAAQPARSSTTRTCTTSGSCRSGSTVR